MHFRRLYTLYYLLLFLGFFILQCTDWDLIDSETMDPLNLTITSTTDSSVTLHWNKYKADNFRWYRIFYSSLQNIPDTSDKVADTLHLSIDTTKTVTALDASKHYYFRIIVQTTDNQISASNVVDTTTLKSPKDIAIHLNIPDTLSVTESSVNLRWDINWIDKYAKFGIFFDTTATVDSLDSCIVKVNDGLSGTVSNLKRNKRYWFRVYTLRNEKYIVGSNILLVQTLSGFPKPVNLDTLSDSAIGSSQLSLKWRASKDTDFHRYILYIDTLATIDTLLLIDSINQRIRIIKSIADTQMNLTKLLPNQRYFITIFVQDTSKLTTKSNTVQGMTKSGFPYATVLSLSGVTDSCITLCWIKNNDKDFKQYDLYVDSSGWSVDTTDRLIKTYLQKDSITTTVTLPLTIGLKPKQYWFGIYTVNTNLKRTLSNVIVNYPLLIGIDTTNTVKKSAALIWTVSCYPMKQFKSYKVFRSKVKNFPITSLRPIADIREYDITTYLDTNLDSATTYYYKINHIAIINDSLFSETLSNEIPFTCK